MPNKPLAAPALPCETPAIPMRTLLDRKGRAEYRRTLEGIDVIYERNDGWTLGAPRRLERRARGLWEGDWIAVYRRVAGGWTRQAMTPVEREAWA